MLLSLIYVSLASISPVIPRTQAYELGTPKRSEAPRSILPEQEAVLFVGVGGQSYFRLIARTSACPFPLREQVFPLGTLWWCPMWVRPHATSVGFAVVQRKRCENSCSSCLWTLRATVMHGSPRYQPVSCVPQCPRVIAGTLQRTSACLLP